jgi:hypothetical protein
MVSMKRHVLRAAFLLCCATPWTLIADSVLLGTDNGGSADPFAGPFPGFAGTQYQEAYAGSDFLEPILITGIDFFLQPGSTGSLYGGTYQLSLSTVTANIANLSETNLAGNPGANNTVFTTVTLAGAAPNTLAFDGGPFYYDPSMGNLLLNIQVSNPSGGGSAIFEDGAGTGPTGIVRYSNFYNGTAGYGLVTEFIGSSSRGLTSLDTPEPPTLIMLGCGLAGLFVGLWRRYSLKAPKVRAPGLTQ